jgi:cation:H+ antiporter
VNFGGDFLLFIVGLGILCWGSELFVAGASALALKFKISPMIVGVTIVAFGSSAPELFVALSAHFQNKSGLVAGNIIGSNICNIALGIGLCCLIRPIKFTHRFRDKEFVFFIASALLFFFLLQYDGRASRADGALFLIGICLFFILCLKDARQQRHAAHFIEEELLPLDEKKIPSWKWPLFKLSAGAGGLHFGSDLLIDSSVAMGHFFGINEMVIGLFLIAVGTSLPEISISIMAALKNEKDIAVGNILGSNIFNILFVGGIASSLKPLELEAQALRIDLPLLLLFSFLLLLLFKWGHQLTRKDGAFLVSIYFLYCFFRFSV